MSFRKEALNHLVDMSLKEASSGISDTLPVYAADMCYKAMSILLHGVASAVVFNQQNLPDYHAEHCSQIIEALHGDNLENLYAAIFIEPDKGTAELIRPFDVFMSMKNILGDDGTLEIGCVSETAAKLLSNAAVIRNDVFNQLETLLGLSE